MNREKAFRIANLIFDLRYSIAITLVQEYGTTEYKVFADLSGKFSDVLKPILALLNRHGFYYQMNEKTPVIEIYFDESSISGK
jgi:hypothetical protein